MHVLLKAKLGPPGKNGTFWKSIQRRLIITLIHSYYIVTVIIIIINALQCTHMIGYKD